MKLINSKIYFLSEMLEDGQCPMCGEPLKWDSAPFEPKVAASAQCCNFLYILSPVDKIVDEEPSVTANVMPVTV